MKKITFLLFVFTMLSFTWQITAQTLNQNAGWPNAAWTVTGTYNTDPLAFEADPTLTANFAFDDDDAGSGSDDSIAAESPVIDLTAAHGAGETWLEISGDYVYNYLANDELKFQYWDADGAAWVDWGFAFTADTASAPTDNYCSGTAESYTSSVLDIAAFTATQLSGFRYRISYNDDPAGADWNYGFCFQSPTITSATPPTCQDPSGMTASNVTDTSADLSWTAGASGETNWNLEWKAGADFAPGTGAEDASDTATGTPAYSATGLTAATTYYIYYQADCGASGGSGVSNWVGPFVGTTACATFTAPYTQDFENAGTIPNCWEQGSTNSENWIFSTSGGHVGDAGTITGSTASGGYFAYVDDSTPDNTGTTLLSPFVDVSGLTTPALLFYEISNNEGNSNVTLTVDVWDGAAWNNVGTYNTNTAGWEQKIIDLSGLTITGPVQARFVVDELVASDFYDDVAIDDVTFDEAPSCLPPSTLTATNITSSSADLGWTDNAGVTVFDIELVDITGGGTATGTPTATGVANPYMASGLAAINDYEFYVRADCGGSGLSDWTGPFSFTTECDTFTPAYTADFTTIAPACWSEGNNTDIATGPDGNNGNWLNDDFLNTVGIEAAKFNLYNLDDTGDWLVSPTFDFTAGGYGLAFDVGVTAFASTDPETPNLMGSDDEVQVLYSIDDGATWTNLETFNVANAPSHLGESRLYDLSAVTSATVKFAFWATEGTVDDAEDVDFFVANFNVDLYTTLGVEETVFGEFKYFPNPVEGTLSLRAQENMENVAVYNMLGQEVINISPNAMTNELDMSTLSQGTYFVRVSINGAIESFKVIKE